VVCSTLPGMPIWRSEKYRTEFRLEKALQDYLQLTEALRHTRPSYRRQALLLWRGALYRYILTIRTQITDCHLPYSVFDPVAHLNWPELQPERGRGRPVASSLR